jgi:predicted RNA-binding Zn-ribbon protein involved in translation (DUF1610 family)
MSEKEAKKCCSCNVEMQFAQKVPFRIKWTRGFWKLVFGEWAELGEGMLSLDVYVCPKCGLTNLYADEKAKQYLLRLTPKAFLKKCVKCGRKIPTASEKCQYCGTNQKEC